MSTSNNNKTAERPPSSPLAPAERMTPSPLASTDNYLSYPSDLEMFTIIMSKMATRDDLNTLINIII